MTLSLYIARKFMGMFFVVFAAFFGIMYMVELVDQIRHLAGTGSGIGRAAVLAVLNVPASVYRILPLITILAAVALFLSLSRSSELVVVRAAGRSALRTLVAPVIAAVVLGLLAVAGLNPVVAGTTKRAEDLAAQYRQEVRNIVSVGREGLWLRQGGPEGQTVIHGRKSNPDGTQLTGVTFVTFDANARPLVRYEATSASLRPGEWVLEKVKIWTMSGDANPELNAERRAEVKLPSDLTADQIRDSFGVSSQISVWDLPDFIASLNRAGFSSRQQQVWLQTELALPLLLGAMVLVGAGLTMRHVRAGRTGLMALASIVFGFAIFFVRNFAQILGENGQIPVVLAAWSPPVAAILLSLALVLHLEDG